MLHDDDSGCDLPADRDSEGGAYGCRACEGEWEAFKLTGKVEVKRYKCCGLEVHLVEISAEWVHPEHEIYG